MTDNHSKIPEALTIDVRKHVTIIGITEGTPDSPAQGWIRTEGLARLGFPELEIRSLPSFMHPAATALLQDVADYLVNSGRTVSLGQRLGLETFGGTTVEFAKLEPIVGQKQHYKAERWALVDPSRMNSEW